ncbi:MAG: ATP-binding protein [Oscillospiraceae bacterium]|nr:ATP-binding protein [Oscillospiraceae bacterium]
MTDMRFLGSLGRKTLVTGHYGSGKTEFSISLAMLRASMQDKKLAIIDLDIINPYFRSRERRKLLEESGVSVYGSAYDEEITAELPAIGAKLRKPLEDSTYQVVIDVGGNDSGALILNQFTKYFDDAETTLLAVVNKYRPDTSSPGGVLKHIASIEAATGLSVSAIVNNSHMLRETTADMVKEGRTLCLEVCCEIGAQLLCSCYPEGIVNPDELSGLSGYLMPLGLYMRPKWLDT